MSSRQAIQCGAVLLGAEDFVATLVNRFGLLEFFELSRVGETPSVGVEDPHQASALAEGFFQLVLTVVTNRAMISSEHTLRKQIIQWLAAGQQMTHSKLIKQITYEKISNKGSHQPRVRTRTAVLRLTLRDVLAAIRGGTDPSGGLVLRTTASGQAGLLPAQTRVLRSSPPLHVFGGDESGHAGACLTCFALPRDAVQVLERVQPLFPPLHPG
jgi:hypothetical protein